MADDAPMPPSGFVKVSGNRRFEYVSRGTGPATLLVHPGGPGFTYHYLRAILKLADSHLRVILFNPRGVGRSWRPARPSSYTIENQADDVEAIRRALDVKELHLLGYSAGGFTVASYSPPTPRRAHPTRRQPVDDRTNASASPTVCREIGVVSWRMYSCMSAFTSAAVISSSAMDR